jgi:uncharacterized protein (DUF2132 family)
MSKIEHTFYAKDLTIKLSVEGKNNGEVKKIFKSLVNQITLSMQDVMDRVAKERILGKSQEQGEWKEEIKQMVLTDCFKDQPDIQRYIDFIEQLLSEREKELLEWVISEEDIPQNVSSLWASLRWFEIYKEAHKRLSKLLKEEK